MEESDLAFQISDCLNKWKLLYEERFGIIWSFKLKDAKQYVVVTIKVQNKNRADPTLRVMNGMDLYVRNEHELEMLTDNIYFAFDELIE